MGADSDINLLIVKRDVSDHRQEYVRIRHALCDIAFHFDIVLKTIGYPESRKDVVGGIAYPANKEALCSPVRYEGFDPICCGNPLIWRVCLDNNAAICYYLATFLSRKKNL